MTTKKVLTLCLACIVICCLAACNDSTKTITTETTSPCDILSTTAQAESSSVENAIISTTAIDKTTTKLPATPHDIMTEISETSAPATSTTNATESTTKKTLYKIPSVKKSKKTLETYTPGTIECEILDLINEERKSNGLRELTMNSDLCSIAAIRANEASVKWSHVRPNGQMSESLFKEYDIPLTHMGENLACSNVEDCPLMMESWMNSPDHRANILEPDFNICGIAAYNAPNGDIYVATIFSA